MSSRLSLHDCTISIRIPTPPTPLPDSPEQIALQSLSSTRDQTEAYIGETIFLLLTLSPKETTASSESLQRAIETCDDPYVYIGSLPHAASNEKPSCRLPVMRETSWLPSKQDGSPVVCKGLWVLVRSPPQTSDLSRALAMAGRQNIVLSLREITVPNMRNSSVWATIDRASRLFGKTVALYATRHILLSMPIEITCQCLTVSGSLDKAFVNVTARNSTSDAYISVVPPYINVSSSRVVHEGADVNSHGRSAALDGQYDFVLMTDEESDDDSTLSNMQAEQDLLLSKQPSDSSVEDYGLFIPSFNHLIRHAARLGPREVYNFIYRIVEKRAEDSSQTESQDRDNKLARPTPRPPRLNMDQCIQTSVAVAWNCSPEQEGHLAVYVNENVSRQMSAGGVLAAGKRSTVAVHITSINWRPPALLKSILVSFSGPEKVVVGSRINVSISVLNQTDRNLHNAKLKVQQDGETYELLALRTVVVVGDILAGCETSLQVPCVALNTGTLSFGKVCVVDERETVWTSESTFRTVVEDEEAPELALDDNVVETATSVPTSATISVEN